jgi:hypothetical protein
MNLKKILIFNIIVLLISTVQLLIPSLREFGVGFIVGYLLFIFEMFILVLPLKYLLDEKKKKRLIIFGVINPFRWLLFGFILYILINIIDLSLSGVIIGIIISSLVFLLSMILIVVDAK